MQCAEPVWDKIFQVNVKNSLQITQLVVPHMRKRKGGAIVYISSIAGFEPINVSILSMNFFILLDIQYNSSILTNLSKRTGNCTYKMLM